MATKNEIKKKKAADQGGKCAISDKPLKGHRELTDADRLRKRSKGGKLSMDNVQVVDPVVHMKYGGNYRKRQEQLEDLKVLIDGREQLRKSCNSDSNRIGAKKRGTDRLDTETYDFLNEKVSETGKKLSKMDRRIKKLILQIDHPIIGIALDVKGIGPVTVAYMLVYVDITKAEHASSLWAYTGLDKPSYERYEKGKSSGGNKKLRTVLYTMGTSMIKTGGAYIDVYRNTKARLAASKKITRSRNNQGQMIECAWKDTMPSHRNDAAIRKMVKHFLADWWFVHRTLEGLPTRRLYVEEQLGHTGIIRPEERGWVYREAS